MTKQQHFSVEEVEQHLQAETPQGRLADGLRTSDRVESLHTDGWSTMSVHSYLRRTRTRQEIAQLWEEGKVGGALTEDD
jgi:hypothetical protein